MPRVSIVTCTYNRAHLIGETIRSVVSQSFQDFEYIIVDDGSTDNTAAVIKTFGDPRISYYFLAHTGKLSYLRNFSHTKCKGEFIAYVDSDDLWETKKLELQVKALDENPPAGFSFTDIEIFNTQGIVRERIYNKTGVYVGNVFQKMLDNQLVVCHTTLVIRKSCLETVGQNDESFRSGDHDFVFRMSQSMDAVVFYQPLVRVRKHNQNTTSDPAYDRMGFEEHHRSLKKLLDRNLISAEQYRKALSTTSYSFGSQLLSAGDAVTAAHYFRMHLALSPFNLKALLKLGFASAKKVFRF